MENLWILTEEKPKCSVIFEIICLYQQDFKGYIMNTGTLKVEDLEIEFPFEDDFLKNQNHLRNNEMKIKPIFKKNVFQFTYCVEGIFLQDIGNIFIKTVSGSSSFFDFLVFKQKDQPEEGSTENLLMAIEETKTNDDESRNTGVYQRSSKFVFIDPYNLSAKRYMLYNNSLGGRSEKKPSDTSIFGTNMLLTLGVDIVGKDEHSFFESFENLDELIEFKSKMRKPPKGNVPIDITRRNGKIEISGRLSKPADKGNIGHDPNIGALSIISKCVRALGWKGDIVITKHDVNQKYVDKTKGKNKFLYICKMLELELDGIIMPQNVNLPEKYWHYEMKSEKYWHYEMKSEKVASILLHIMGENNGLKEVYQNHAGCERGYFITPTKELITLPKKDCQDENLYIPDLVLFNSSENEILLIEGKQMSTLQKGLEEIENYDSIENEFVKVHYPNANIIRCLSIFGDYSNNDLNEQVLLYLNTKGEIYINPNAPKYIKDMFK